MIGAPLDEDSAEVAWWRVASATATFSLFLRGFVHAQACLAAQP